MLKKCGPEAQADVRAPVADHATLGELAVDALRAGHLHDDRSAATFRVVRAARREARFVEQLDQ